MSTYSVHVSVSCEQTFETDISENAAVTIHLYHTVLELERRIKKNDFEGRTLILKVKFLDFIRLLGLGVSNQGTSTPQKGPQWIEQELPFAPWPDE